MIRKKKFRILVVDDSVDNRNLIENFLATSEYKLHFAQNGIEAVDSFKEHNVSVILMDMEMPVMSGYAAAEAIRDLEGGDAVSIIALTAHQGHSEVKKCIDAGCTSFLAKPIRKPALMEVIGKYS